MQITDQRLFAAPLTREQIRFLEDAPELAKRIDAFLSRFGRLQDPLGDKPLPQVLCLVEAIPAARVDNHDRTERLGWIASAERCFGARKLGNQMVHEYTEDAVIRSGALPARHELVPFIASAAPRMLAEVDTRLGAA